MELIKLILKNTCKDLTQTLYKQITFRKSKEKQIHSAKQTKSRLRLTGFRMRLFAQKEEGAGTWLEKQENINLYLVCT